MRDDVKATALWLDEVMPGWEQELNFDTIDMSSTCQCVAGQLGAAVARREGFKVLDSGYMGEFRINGYACMLSADSWVRLLDADDERLSEGSWLGQIEEVDEKLIRVLNERFPNRPEAAHGAFGGSGALKWLWLDEVRARVGR